jgi:hypothetical protein
LNNTATKKSPTDRRLADSALHFDRQVGCHT